MIEQYKKTLLPMQTAIVALSLGALFWSHRALVASAFFLVMQLSAGIGAAWGARLKGKIERAGI